MPIERVVPNDIQRTHCGMKAVMSRSRAVLNAVGKAHDRKHDISGRRATVRSPPP